MKNRFRIDSKKCYVGASKSGRNNRCETSDSFAKTTLQPTFHVAKWSKLFCWKTKQKFLRKTVLEGKFRCKRLFTSPSEANKFVKKHSKILKENFSWKQNTLQDTFRIARRESTRLFENTVKSLGKGPLQGKTRCKLCWNSNSILQGGGFHSDLFCFITPPDL